MPERLKILTPEKENGFWLSSPNSANNNEPNSDIISTPLYKAKQFSQLCQELDSANQSGISEENKILYNQKISELKHLIISSVASTPYLHEYLLDLARQIDNGESSLQFSSLSELAGIDLENDQLGAFTKEGAQKVEERQLRIFLPAEIMWARKNGQFQRTEQLMNLHSRWLDAYQQYYNPNPKDIDSIKANLSFLIQRQETFRR
jgi:hypothetical protein